MTSNPGHSPILTYSIWTTMGSKPFDNHDEFNEYNAPRLLKELEAEQNDQFRKIDEIIRSRSVSSNNILERRERLPDINDNMTVGEKLDTVGKRQKILTKLYRYLDPSNSEVKNFQYKIVSQDGSDLKIEPVDYEIVEQITSDSSYTDSDENLTFNSEFNLEHESSIQESSQHQETNQLEESVKKEHNESMSVINNCSKDIQAQNVNEDVICLGPYGTRIPSALFQSVDFESISCATRHLLSILFSRDTLATHSLTGKPSPAFHGLEMPLKNQLDPYKIADIIYAVKKFANAKEREVRSAITTKCADENKIFRNRLKKRNRKPKQT